MSSRMGDVDGVGLGGRSNWNVFAAVSITKFGTCMPVLLPVCTVLELDAVSGPVGVKPGVLNGISDRLGLSLGFCKDPETCSVF